MRLLGFPPAEIQKAADELMAKAAPSEAMDIHPDNVFAVKLFLAMQTQWMWTSLSTMTTAKLFRVGLKYEVLKATAGMSRLGKISADDFTRIRMMEAHALNAWAEVAA